MKETEVLRLIYAEQMLLSFHEKRIDTAED